MAVSFGYGGIPENVLFFGNTVLLRKTHLPSNQAPIQNASVAKNVRCGRDYICAKFYALIPFCSIFTKIWWTNCKTDKTQHCAFNVVSLHLLIATYSTHDKSCNSYNSLNSMLASDGMRGAPKFFPRFFHIP